MTLKPKSSHLPAAPLQPADRPGQFLGVVLLPHAAERDGSERAEQPVLLQAAEQGVHCPHMLHGPVPVPKQRRPAARAAAGADAAGLGAPEPVWSDLLHGLRFSSTILTSVSSRAVLSLAAPQTQTISLLLMVLGALLALIGAQPRRLSHV